MQEKIIAVEKVNFFFDDRHVLEDVSFDVEKGDIVSIVGPNGSGKSTLLKVIIGILKPASGKVLIAGRSPKKMKGKIAYVPQRFELEKDVPVSVLEFMGMEKCGNHSNSKESIVKKLAEVGLHNVEDKKLGELSGGQFQRMMIARALLHEKEILIFDEPLAGIDVAGEATIYDLIRDINEKNKTTCLIVSHELNIVNKYSTHVICLNKKVCCMGKPEDVLTERTIKELYGSNIGLYHGH